MKKLLFLLLLLLAPLSCAVADDQLYQAISNTPVLVKAALDSYHPVRLLGWPEIVNPDASTPVYLHFYDAASAGAVTVGTTPDVFIIAISAGPGHATFMANGVTQHVFQNGMVIAATTSRLTGGTTAPPTALTGELQFQ